MSLSSLCQTDSMMVLEQVLQFTEARHTVLAANVSNLDTVDYTMKDLDQQAFRETLADQLKQRREGTHRAPSRSSSRGSAWKPVEIEPQNILFHDRNNRFVEQQMSAMGQNALLHHVSSELLRGVYDGVELAIRGRF